MSENTECWVIAEACGVSTGGVAWVIYKVSVVGLQKAVDIFSALTCTF